MNKDSHLRIKCVNNKSEGIEDVELTIGKFYDIIFSDIRVMGKEEKFISLIGDSGVEIQRPVTWFKVFRPIPPKDIIRCSRCPKKLFKRSQIGKEVYIVNGIVYCKECFYLLRLRPDDYCGGAKKSKPSKIQIEFFGEFTAKTEATKRRSPSMHSPKEPLYKESTKKRHK